MDDKTCKYQRLRAKSHCLDAFLQAWEQNLLVTLYIGGGILISHLQ